MKVFPLVATVFVLAACSVELLGRAQPYDPRVPEPVEVVMPAGAHWLSQQFAPFQEGVPYEHRGIDVRARTGTRVIAAAPGRVVAAFRDPMHGAQVVVDHGMDVDGALVVTRYHHLSRIDVEEGQVLARGAPVGRLGSSGAAAVFEHLHFELRRGESVAKAQPVDPQLYWVAGPGLVTCFEPGARWTELPIRITYPVVCE